MSKIKDQLQRQEEVQQEYYYKFMDHIYDVLNPEPRLSESDINIMEQDYCHSQIAPTKNISTSVPKSAINTTETTTRRSA